ncbi:MOSC domain protein [Rutstroemia sp. NJR-2017a WRK4]|nr:MOSC domain protein [Rutstroemia sp. NJR-2017a WRK4]
MLRSLNPFAAPSTSTEITGLYIYPIKSCRGISVQSTLLTTHGLDLDRRWMFVSGADNKFITIRENSSMTLIDTSFTTSAESPSDIESLVISIRNADKSVSVPARPTEEWLKDNTTLAQVKIWDYETDGYIYGDEVNGIFSEFFQKDVKLVYKGPTPRIMRGNASAHILGREESTNFPDVMSILIANEASLRELNGRLQKKGHDPITIERFRANIIVRGKNEEDDADRAPEAWSEDRWKVVNIVNTPEPTGLLSSVWGSGGLSIDVQARCARCQVPNVDPDTAEKDKREPWDTLVSYRRVDEGIKFKPCFGMLSVPRTDGPIAVGMKLEVVETTDNHNYKKGF